MPQTLVAPGLTTGHAPFVEEARDRGELYITQAYELYSEENHESWRRLYERIRPRWEQRPPEERAADIERTPLRRMGEAVDQANVICFLASAHADFVTGLTIDVTGGL